MGGLLSEESERGRIEHKGLIHDREGSIGGRGEEGEEDEGDVTSTVTDVTYSTYTHVPSHESKYSDVSSSSSSSSSSFITHTLSHTLPPQTTTISPSLSSTLALHVLVSPPLPHSLTPSDIMSPSFEH